MLEFWSQCTLFFIILFVKSVLGKNITLRYILIGLMNEISRSNKNISTKNIQLRQWISLIMSVPPKHKLHPQIIMKIQHSLYFNLNQVPYLWLKTIMGWIIRGTPLMLNSVKADVSLSVNSLNEVKNIFK